jgi:pimeloyl-ACP methyl ester carboxylesterase
MKILLRKLICNQRTNFHNNNNYYIRNSSSLLSYDKVINRNRKIDNINDISSIAFLHGILGSKRNWRTPCNVWVKHHPNFESYSIDHRGHGDSKYADVLPPHNITGCANDLEELFSTILSKQDNIYETPTPTILVAHSFGGKIALRYLEERNRLGLPLPKHLWIIDSLPGLYDLNKDDVIVSKVFDLLYNKLPQRFESKEWMLKRLLDFGIEKGISQWLVTNVIADGDECTWNLNLPIIKSAFQDFCETDMWNFLEGYNGDCKIHFLRAGKNKAWTDVVLNKFSEIIKHHDSSYNSNIKLHTMSHVGHWVHSEDLPALVTLISKESGLS